MYINQSINCLKLYPQVKKKKKNTRPLAHHWTSKNNISAEDMDWNFDKFFSGLYS